MTEPEAQLEAMASVLRDLDPQLDELARARIQARLFDAIDAEHERKPRSRRALALAAVAGLGLVAAAAAGVLVIAREASHAPVRDVRAARQAPAAPPPAPVVAIAGAQPAVIAEALALVPYCVSGASGRDVVPLLGQAQRALAVPLGSVVRVALGARARLSLVGPAQLELIAATSGRIELSLSHGLLAIDYAGALGGDLLVRTAQARVRVVGTRFAVAAAGDETRVGVASGVVEVEHGGRLRSLSAASAWRASTDVTTTLGGDLQQLMDAHGQALMPPPRGQGLLSIAGAQRSIRARLGDRLLGETPVWALVPIGAVAVTFDDTRGRSSVMKTEVAATGTAALSSTPAGTSALPARAKSPEPSAAQHDAGSAAALYRRAEQALHARDRAAAQHQLEQLINRFPQSAEAEPALYELAQLAGACAQERPLLDAYLARYPNGRFATGARERLSRCQLAKDRPVQPERPRASRGVQ